MDPEAEECRHGLEIGCTICSTPLEAWNDPTIVKPAKPRKRKPAGKVDPAVRLAGEVASGYRCGECLTPRVPIGCQCSRDRIFRDDVAVLSDQLHEAVECSMLTPKEAGGMMLAGFARAARRCGIDPETRDDLRMALMREFAVEPRWTAPRRNEMNLLPV